MNTYLENVKANHEASIRGWNAAMNGEPLSPKDETDRFFLHGYHEASLHLEWRKMTKLPIKYPEHPETISAGSDTESLLRDILAELRLIRQNLRRTDHWSQYPHWWNRTAAGEQIAISGAPTSPTNFANQRRHGRRPPRPILKIPQEPTDHHNTTSHPLPSQPRPLPAHRIPLPAQTPAPTITLAGLTNSSPENG